MQGMMATAPAAMTAAAPSARDSGQDGDEKMAAASFLLSLTNPKAESMVRALINEPRCSSRDEELLMPMATGSDMICGGGSMTMADADADADALDLFLPPSSSGQPGMLGDLAANGGGLFANSGFFPWSLGPQSVGLGDFYVMERDDCSTMSAAPSGDNLGDSLSNPTAPLVLPPNTAAAAQEASIAAVVDALQETHDWFARTGQAYDGGGGVPFSRERLAATATLALARPNVRAFVSSYFRNTHHDFPLLHRASFAVEAAAPELLLAVVLCGSLYSAPTDGALSCRGLFHLAEELAFRRLAAALAAAEREADLMAAAAKDGGSDGVERNGCGGGGMETTTRLHETLQAALIMHGLQNTMSSAPARRRNRTVRLPALVSVVRTLGLARTRHEPWTPSGAETDESRWAEFVHTETRIR